MISPDTRLSRSFRYYDAQIKWLAPGGLTVNELADALYAQWLKHSSVKRRYGIDITRESAMNAIASYIRAVFNDSVQGFLPTMQIQTLPPRQPSPPKARTCCKGRA